MWRREKSLDVSAKYFARYLHVLVVHIKIQYIGHWNFVRRQLVSIRLLLLFPWKWERVWIWVDANLLIVAHVIVSQTFSLMFVVYCQHQHHRHYYYYYFLSENVCHAGCASERHTRTSQSESTNYDDLKGRMWMKNTSWMTKYSILTIHKYASSSVRQSECVFQTGPHSITTILDDSFSFLFARSEFKCCWAFFFFCAVFTFECDETGHSPNVHI